MILKDGDQGTFHVDKDSFGSLNRTYTIEFKDVKFNKDWVWPDFINNQTEKTKQSVLSSWTPQELDLPFPEMTRIYTGGCGAVNDPRHQQNVNFSFSTFLAHTHKCPKDPLLDSVCLPHKGFIRQTNDEISSIMWHEYGHVLTDLNWKVVECVSPHYHTFDITGGELVEPHGKEWLRIMNLLGKPEINSPHIQYTAEEFDTLFDLS